MVGNVLDEANIFRQIIVNETYETLKAALLEFIQEPELDAVLDMYGIRPDISAENLRAKFEDLATDACFTLQNRIHASVSKIPKTYAFHIDQLARFEFPFDGLAYHAIDVAYFSMNLTERLTLPQQKLAEKIAGDLFNFAWDREPWKPYGQDKHWMVYGPDSKWAVKIEIEVELIGNYKRMDRILHMGGGFLNRRLEAVDYFANQRWLQNPT
ncbi:hypothetical protein GGP41_009668 [Bipolaris sorokiniana]|uniref:Carboxylesterase type B domain-containing protein n=1 Tax=Cochliobolus sativus TaxID=45130 RepID=A0A8H5ZI13_COCSA|nr:hypothetical protein GGP41_009668 [Bipolaris sorokiniana]